HIKTFRQARREVFRTDAKVAAGDRAAADEPFHDAAREIDGDGKTDAFISHGTAFDLRVDADEPAFGVHERAAGISRIDGGVSLDEVLDGVAGARHANVAAVAAQRADNAHRHALTDFEWIADREHNVAHFEFIAVAEGDGGQAGGVNFQHGHVRGRVGADHFGGVFLFAVRNRHLDFIHAVHNVVGGQNIAIGGDDDSGAEAFYPAGDFTLIAVALAGGTSEELAEKRVVEHGIPIQPLVDDVSGKDVDDARRGFFDDGRVAGKGPGGADDGRIVHADGRGRLLGPGGEIKQVNHPRRAD